MPRVTNFQYDMHGDYEMDLFELVKYNRPPLTPFVLWNYSSYDRDRQKSFLFPLVTSLFCLPESWVVVFLFFLDQLFLH